MTDIKADANINFNKTKINSLKTNQYNPKYFLFCNKTRVGKVAEM